MDGNQASQNLWARYAEDAVIHCRTKEEAERLLSNSKNGSRNVNSNCIRIKLGLFIAKMMTAKKNIRRPNLTFWDTLFGEDDRRIGFENTSSTLHQAMRQTIRGWRMHLKPDMAIDDLSRMFNASIRGWINYYGHFYKSQLYPVLRHLNEALIHWARRKYKKLEMHKTQAIYWMERLAKNLP